MDDPSTVTVLVMLSIFSICGTIGNSLVLYIYSNKKEKSTAGIFIMSLAGTDLVTCLLIVPYTEAVVYLEYELKYDAVCKIYMFLITCNIPFAAFIMVAIALDRYFCICHPFLHVLNIQRAKIIILCLLALTSTFGVITALIHGVFVYHNVVIADIHNSSAAFASLVQATFPNKSSVTSSSYPCTGNTSLCSNMTSALNTSYIFESLQEGTKRIIVYFGVCVPNSLIIGPTFASIYQKIYGAFYLLSFTAVSILYGLIYKSIHHHRAKRSKRKRSSLYPSGVEFSAVETQFTAVTHVNPHGKNNGRIGSGDSAGDCIPDESEPTQPLQKMATQPIQQQKHRKFSKAMSIKEKTLMANIRTAAMLFVVTVVFLIAFLPAFLMAHGIVDYNQVVFYMYFVYNTANPFIYAFMNKSFRDDLGKVLKCQSVPVVR